MNNDQLGVLEKLTLKTNALTSRVFNSDLLQKQK